MPFHRILTISNLPNAANGARKIAKFKSTRFVRWQQTGASGSTSSSVAKLLLYGVAGAGVGTAVTVAYANYDPIFKNRVNEYIPVFGQLSDSVADKWVSLSDSRRQKGSSDVGLTATNQMNMAPKPFTIPVSKAEGTAQPEKPISTKTKEDKFSTKPSLSTNETSTITPIAHHSETEELATDVSSDLPSSERVAVEVDESVLPVGETDETPQVSTEHAESIHKPSPIPEDTVPGDIVPGDTVISSDKETLPTVEKDIPDQVLYPIENAVASVKEETDKTAAKIMAEQVKDHQASQTLGEQWLKDTSKVEASLEEVFKEYKTLTTRVSEAQKALVDAITNHRQTMSDAMKSGEDEHVSVESVAEGVASSEEVVDDKRMDMVSALEKHTKQEGILESSLLAAEKAGLKSKVDEMQDEIAALDIDFQVGKSNIDEAESSNKVMAEYREEARKSRERLQSELGTVPPVADMKQETIILMLHKRIEILKEKLEDAENTRTQALTAALEKQKEKLEELANEKQKLILQRQQLQLEQEFLKKESDIIYQLDSELREKLRLQSEAHTSHLADALVFQANELAAKWSTELELKLMEQETKYQTGLAKALSRLRGIESMVNTVANAGEATRQQQSIRNACDTLIGALEQANTNPEPSERYIFSKELLSLREAARGDKFILSTLDSIPRQATSAAVGGIQSEAGLKERFRKVYRVCKRVALVPETGGGLGTYALSYVQSLLVFNIRTNGRVQPGQDLSKLDTFDLLNLANMSMKRGDMESAVWYVNHLKDESRRVAQGWLEDARLYLETKQAFTLIQTYMAARNISFVQ